MTQEENKGNPTPPSTLALVKESSELEDNVPLRLENSANVEVRRKDGDNNNSLHHNIKINTNVTHTKLNNNSEISNIYKETM